MEAQVKRKIITPTDSTTTSSSNYLRSTTNIVTNANTTAPVKARARITVNTNTFASKNDAPLSAQPRARSKSPVRISPPRSGSTSVRSPSPIKTIAKSSPVTRVTSPEFQQKLKSVMPAGTAPTVAIPRARSIIGGPTSANPVASSSSSSPKFSSTSSRVTSPTPTLRAVASTHSLPGSPRLRPASMIVNATGGGTPTAGSSLRPSGTVNPNRNHLRNNSVSDTSTLSTHSPASSSVGTGQQYEGGPNGFTPIDGPSRPITARSPSPVRSAQSSTSPPPIRVKSKVSSLAVKALGVNGNNAGPPSPSVPSNLNNMPQRKVSVTSAGGRGGTTTPRQRSPSISSAVSSPPTLLNRPISRAKANIHFNNYQPFPVPPLPAPPPPEAIHGLLNGSPPASPRLGFQKSPPISPPPIAATFPRQQKGTPSPPNFAKVSPDQTVGSPSSVTTAREIHALLDRGGGDPEKLGSPIAEDGMQDMQSEARTNRKIEDLEITNRSLLAINAMLEATKARQAKEIRELKRKLRETRLTLPPKAYDALRSSEANASTEDITAPKASESVSSDEDEEEEEGEPEPDPSFDRISHMLEAMLSHASEAVKMGKEPLVVEERMVKVLSAAEVESYHRTSLDRSAVVTAVEEHDRDHDHDHDELESVAPTDSEADGDGDASLSVDDSFTSIDTDSVASESRVPPLSPFPPLLTITSDSPVTTRPLRGLPFVRT